MRLETLKVENIMGCKYEIEFDPTYTIIIGDNRQGKTLVARLIMLALYGLGKDKEIHPSWKLRQEELVKFSDKGTVELVFEQNNTQYKIYREFSTKKNKVHLAKKVQENWIEIARKETEIKHLLEEEINLTPGLLNIVMSNEQSLIGAISYDERLQASVWEGWKWKHTFIRENIQRAKNKCQRKEKELKAELRELEEESNSILKKWIEKGIFSHKEIKLNRFELEGKIDLITSQIELLDQKIKNYQDFFYDLIREDDLTNKATIQDLIQNLIKQRELLDPKEEIQAFLVRCEEYLELLNQVLRYGSREGIENRLRQLEDEEKKLKEAREIKQRKKTPLLAKCSIYPPEGGTNLIVQLPEDLAQRFRYEEIVRGKIGVPYYEEKEKEIKEDKNLLLDLKQRFEQSQDHLKRLKDNLRTQISKTSEDLRHKKMVLQEQRTILEADKERFLKNREETEKISKIVKKVKKAKEWFARLWEALDEGEALKRIKKETIAYINRIYEEIYNWEINARLEEDDKIVITDTHGNIRSHPSGSEIHVMGLAWRWLIARGFDLPLVLDELDALLDEKNFERTKELIKERLDRQTIILTLKEGLKSLPGKIYKVTRQGEISFLSPFIF